MGTTMTQAEGKIENPAIRIGLVIGGLVLMGFGIQQMLLGWHKRPLSVVEDQPVTPVAEIVSEREDPGFHLTFDGESGRWIMAAAQGGIEERLPAGIPEPPAFEVPARAMSLEQWQRYIGDALQSGGLRVSAKALQDLRSFSIGGENPFSLLGSNVPRDRTKEKNPQMDVVEIPPEFNPKTRAFEQEMLAWQAEVKTTLRASKVEREGYRADSTHPSMGSRTALMFTSIARNRVLSGDFGRKRQDILIYLQVLCNFHRVYLKIDGVTGPRTRKSVADFAFLVLPQEKIPQRVFAAVAAVDRILRRGLFVGRGWFLCHFGYIL